MLTGIQQRHINTKLNRLLREIREAREELLDRIIPFELGHTEKYPGNLEQDKEAKERLDKMWDIVHPLAKKPYGELDEGFERVADVFLQEFE